MIDLLRRHAWIVTYAIFVIVVLTLTLVIGGR